MKRKTVSTAANGEENENITSFKPKKHHENAKKSLKAQASNFKEQANEERKGRSFTSNKPRQLRLKQEKNKICNFVHAYSQNRKPHGKLQERVFIHENLEENEILMSVKK